MPGAAAGGRGLPGAGEQLAVAERTADIFRANCGALSLVIPVKRYPETQTWPRLWAATPRWSYWKAKDDEFARQYLGQLDRYGPERIGGWRQVNRAGHPMMSPIFCPGDTDTS